MPRQFLLFLFIFHLNIESSWAKCPSKFTGQIKWIEKDGNKGIWENFESPGRTCVAVDDWCIEGETLEPSKHRIIRNSETNIWNLEVDGNFTICANDETSKLCDQISNTTNSGCQTVNKLTGNFENEKHELYGNISVCCFKPEHSPNPNCYQNFSRWIKRDDNPWKNTKYRQYGDSNNCTSINDYCAQFNTRFYGAAKPGENPSFLSIEKYSYCDGTPPMNETFYALKCEEIGNGCESNHKLEVDLGDGTKIKRESEFCCCRGEFCNS